jgi:6-phosphofructokinase 1
MTGPKKLAILCAGGPAPGINSVIGAATIRGILSGVEVLGIRDGFQWIMEGEIAHVTPLTIEAVSRLHFRGGSFIGISRANPTRKEEHLEKTIISLLRLNVDKLITIGGDDTLFSAYRLEQKSMGRIRVAHVPKTIDNDLDLPMSTSTFGFQTARHIGVEIVKNLMVDAHTTSRWYFVVTMGRKAGHLALGIGKAAGATMTLIPEEFGKEKLKLGTVVDTLVGAIIKRLSYGRPDGVVVIAEGLVEMMDPNELEALLNLERDEHDHIRLAEVNFGEILKFHVQDRLKKLGLKSTIVAKNIGYELRCADPIPVDMEYTRDLGHCASQFLIEGAAEPSVSWVRRTSGRFRSSRSSTRTPGACAFAWWTSSRLGTRSLTLHDSPAARTISRIHTSCEVRRHGRRHLEQFQEQFHYLVEHEPQPMHLTAPDTQRHYATPED